MRQYDLVILGATGFTGRLACEYLGARYASGCSWLATGRSAQKLAELRDDLALRDEQTAVCDVTDDRAVDELVKSAKVVANFAGTPFIDKALPIVDACARHGTCYVDITGETALHRASYDKHHAAAGKSGALIVHSCGFDSVPSDLSAYLAVRQMRSAFGAECAELRVVAGKASGGVSGGTLATGLFISGAQAKDCPGVKEAAARGAYALDPDGAAGGPDTSLLGAPLIGYDRRLRTWWWPSIMAAVNTPVVRKSAALLNYGRCRVSEVSACASAAGALALTATTGLALLLVGLPPVRALLFALKLLPRPGEGPSKSKRDNGHFHVYCLGVAAGGADAPAVVGHVRSGSAGDPGYKATALMAVESALAMALERKGCADGGVLTPAAALGMVLVNRLNAAGMQLSAETLPSTAG